MKHATQLWLIAGLLWSAGVTAPVQAGESPGPSPADAERVVRDAYGRLEELIGASGADFSFELDELRNVSQEDFDELRWVDVVTMPEVPMIDVHRSTHTRRIEGEPDDTRVQYIPSWNDSAARYLDTEEGRRLAPLTVRQVLREIAPHQPDYGEVESVTAFSVRVDLAGRQRAYQAAVLWGPDDNGEDFNAIFVDHITQALADAILEQSPPASKEWREESSPRARKIVVHD